MTRLRPLGVARGALVFAALLAFPFVFSEHWIVNIAFFVVMYAALATAWNIVGGYSGYLSLGHVGFFGVGAYAIAILFTHIGVGSGLRPFAVLPLVGVGTGIACLPIAWLALRTRAATFAIVTLTLLFVVQQLAFNLHSLTNGSQGILLPIAPFAFSNYERPFYLGMLGLFAVAMLVSWWIKGSKLGLMLFAIRDDEDRARGVGVHVTRAKLVAFGISAGLTAMVGGIWAYYIGAIYPEFAVDPLITIGMVLMVYLGGRGTLWGPVLGAFLLVPAQQYLAYRLGASELYLIAYSAVFLIVILLMPRGILPSIADQVTRIRSGRAARRGDVRAAGSQVVS